MSDLKIIGNNAAATTNEPVNVQITPGKRTYTKSRSAVSTKEAETYEAAEDLLEAEADYEAADEFTGEEGFEEDAVEGSEYDESVEEGEYTDSDVIDDGYTDQGFIDEGYIEPGFIDDGYIDPGFFEEGYMDPGMEMGMGEVKEPLLSSWPFVIGISAAVFAVSIVLGVLLAKMRIKKGIDLYED